MRFLTRRRRPRIVPASSPSAARDAGAFPAFALLCLVGLLAVPAFPALAEDAPAPPSPGASDGVPAAVLLDGIRSESASTRERAAAALESLRGLTEADLAAAMDGAPARSVPLLLRVAAARRMTGLVGRILPHLTGRDEVAAEAAARALVRLSPEGVEAGEKALGAAPADERGVVRLRHLRALDAQRRVERAVLSGWRRKGGSYRGRYTALADLGPVVQPVLVAMLLDIPLEDQHLIPDPLPPGAAALSPEERKELETNAWRRAVVELSQSPRRGYATFDPIPFNIEQEELFTLAYQALADVADLAVTGDVLRRTHRALLDAHEAAGFRVRPFEDSFAESIEVILSARGDSSLLEARLTRVLEEDVRPLRRRLRGSDPEDQPDLWHYFAGKLGDQASVLHQLQRWDEAAKIYGEIIRIVKSITGKEPAVDGYNRACALARGGKVEDALDQLAVTLDPELSQGFEDLTREWVEEDGDLTSLRTAPRFREILRKRFGD